MATVKIETEPEGQETEAAETGALETEAAETAAAVAEAISEEAAEETAEAMADLGNAMAGALDGLAARVETQQQEIEGFKSWMEETTALLLSIRAKLAVTEAGPEPETLPEETPPSEPEPEKSEEENQEQQTQKRRLRKY